MSNLIDFNGEFLSPKSAQLSVFHSVVKNAESLVEKIRVFESKILFSEDHYFHLMASMRIMRMFIPMGFTPIWFEEKLNQFIQKNSIQNGLINFHVAIDENEVLFWIYLEKLSEEIYWDNPNFNLEIYREAHIANDFYNQLFTPNPTERIHQIFAKENDFTDLFLLNESKKLARTMLGSIFLINGTNATTPKLEEGAKNGVWRKKCIEILQKSPEFDSITEEEIFPFALQKADEVFLVLEGKGIQSVQQFRKKIYSTECTNEFVVRLNEALN